MPRLAAPLILSCLLLLAGDSWATTDEGGEAPAAQMSAQESTEAPAATSEAAPSPARNMASEKYDEAHTFIAEAQKIDERTAQIDDAVERHAVDAGARNQYRRALRYLRFTASEQPDHYAAHSDIGYVLIRLGDYPRVLESCGRALEVKPDYWRALECRGEAFLRLGRLDDAKHAYTTLLPEDPDLAGVLLAKMDRWAQTRRDDRGEMSREEIESFASWVSSQQKSAGQTASVDAAAREGQGLRGAGYPGSEVIGDRR